MYVATSARGALTILENKLLEKYIVGVWVGALDVVGEALVIFGWEHGVACTSFFVQCFIFGDR